MNTTSCVMKADQNMKMLQNRFQSIRAVLSVHRQTARTISCWSRDLQERRRSLRNSTISREGNVILKQSLSVSYLKMGPVWLNLKQAVSRLPETSTQAVLYV